MSSMRNPVGPEEPSVYWRRRAAVVVGLLVALWLLWWLFSGVFGSDDAPADQPVTPTTSAAPVTPTATPDGAATTPKAGSTPQTKAKAGASPKQAKAKAKTAAAKPPTCADGDVAVVVQPADRSGEVGAGMKVTMTVTNTGSTTCRRDVGAADNEIQVVSGRVLVWSSDFCAGVQDGTSADAAIVTLKSKQSWSTTITWPGKVTLSSCPDSQPTATSGTYRALGTNGAKRSAESRFTLS